MEELEQRFLLGSGISLGAIKHLGGDDREQLTVHAMQEEAVTTSEIEGEILDRASLQSSIRRHLGLATDDRRPRPAEEGIAELMVDLMRGFDKPLTHQTLFDWHGKLMRGRRDVQNVGAYRTGEEPMQIVSGQLSTDAPSVHFEAPPSERVPAEMRRFLTWFNEAERGLPPLTRSGIAHLYFESIHPFEDGNGRIGRAISEKALAQRAGQPTFTSLATVILAKRRAYYHELELASQDNEITTWLRWFGETACEAQERTNRLIEFLVAKGRLLERLAGKLNARQEKALVRLFREGPEGFKGGLSAGNYVSITGASTATATRDLAGLVEMGALTRTGEVRHARYWLRL
jgi:Fic family protein